MAAAIVFANLGAAYGTAKSGVGISSMGVMNADAVMKSIIPIVMAGALGIYMDFCYHFIRQHVAERTIFLHFIGTEDMAADSLTKALERVKHEKGMRMLGMQRV